MENHIQIENLILKMVYRTITEEERQLLNDWINESPANRQIFDEYIDLATVKKNVAIWERVGQNKERVWNDLQERLLQTQRYPVRKVAFLRRYWQVAAAVVVIVLGVLVYSVTLNREEVKPDIAKVQDNTQDVQPGGNKAMLTLANGETIVLENVQNGMLAKEGTSEISKADGVISYSKAVSKGHQLLYNTLSVPKGGQYQLVLNDGTKVWLNSASSIRYPAMFGDNERIVEITGEAYFEVARNTKKPFHVVTRGTDIKVLGTHFNVMSYEEESAIECTLLEGAVQVTKEGSNVFLKPGQQAVLQQGKNLTVQRDVDLEEVMAWKNGKFVFSNTSIPAILRQLGRWYDLEIVYEGAAPSFSLTGEANRNESLSNLIKKLQLSEVKCRIEGKKLIVPVQ